MTRSQRVLKAIHMAERLPGQEYALHLHIAKWVASLGNNTCAARKYPEPSIHLLKCICTHFQWAAMEKLYPSIKTSKILKQRECKITGKNSQKT